MTVYSWFTVCLRSEWRIFHECIASVFGFLFFFFFHFCRAGSWPGKMPSGMFQQDKHHLLILPVISVVLSIRNPRVTLKFRAKYITNIKYRIAQSNQLARLNANHHLWMNNCLMKSIIKSQNVICHGKWKEDRRTQKHTVKASADRYLSLWEWCRSQGKNQQKCLFRITLAECVDSNHSRNEPEAGC